MEIWNLKPTKNTSALQKLFPNAIWECVSDWSPTSLNIWLCLFYKQYILSCNHNNHQNQDNIIGTWLLSKPQVMQGLPLQCRVYHFSNVLYSRKVKSRIIQCTWLYFFFNLFQSWIVLSLCLVFMTLINLKIPDQLFCSMSFYLELTCIPHEVHKILCFSPSNL